MRRIVAINALGRRIGEDHHNALLTNVEIELFFILRDEGWSYGKLAFKFDISKSCARHYCKGNRRSQVECRWKTLK